MPRASVTDVLRYDAHAFLPEEVAHERDVVHADIAELKSRAVARIERIPRVDPYADPGAAIIDVYCA